MIRALSLLLIIPLFCTQLWAISGGPYNSLNSREISAFSGTYGVSMRGMQRVPLGSQQDDQTVLDKPLTYRESDPANDNDVSTTAVLYLTVPNSGIVNGKIMLFHKGLMYIGTSTGMVERRRMSILMLSELTHYIVLSGTEFRQTIASNSPSANPQSSQAYFQSVGLNGAPRTVMDSMLAGQIDLTLSLNQFTGLINVDGWANYVEVGAESPSPLSTGTLSSITRDMVTSLISVNNGAFSGGTWSTMQTPEKVKQPQNTKVNGLNGLKLKAEGCRNTTETVALANFIAPRSGTYWQIWGGVPSDLYGSNAAAAGGGDGAASATAALAAVSNVSNNVVGGTQVTALSTVATTGTATTALGTLTGTPNPNTPNQVIPTPTATVNPITSGTTNTTDPNSINNFLNNF